MRFGAKAHQLVSSASESWATPDAPIVWHANGATVVPTVDDVFERTTIVFVVLVNADVTDSVLGRGTTHFDRRVAERTVIATGSASPDYLRSLQKHCGSRRSLR